MRYSKIDTSLKTHGKYSIDILKKAACRRFDSLNYLIKMRN